MLAAHMDEIGVVVSHVEKRGPALPGGRVERSQPDRGRVRLRAPAVIGPSRRAGRGDVPRLDQLFTDVGATSKESSPVGGRCRLLDRDFVDLGGRLVAKALDDCIACAVLIQAMKEPGETPHELELCSLCRKAGAARCADGRFGIDADLGIAVDGPWRYLRRNNGGWRWATARRSRSRTGAC